MDAQTQQIENEQTAAASSTSESAHLRAAWALIGTLIGRGAISVDFDDTNWCDDLQLNVRAVAAMLDSLELEA